MLPRFSPESRRRLAWAALLCLAGGAPVVSADDDLLAPPPFVQATGAFEQGDLESAEKLVAPLAADAAASAEVCSLLGQIRMRQGRPADAVVAFERALAQNPASAQNRSRLGVVLLVQAAALQSEARTAALQRAKVEFERAASDEADCVDAQMGLLRLALDAPEMAPPGAAERHAARAAELDPLTATYEVAELAEQKNRFDLAERYYAATHKLFPDNPWLQFKQAIMLARTGRTGEARALLEALLARMPGFQPASEVLKQLPAS
ncbi:MAG: tetratricopeptide repeat protein [Opitutaceae bacterium]